MVLVEEGRSSEINNSDPVAFRLKVGVPIGDCFLEPWPLKQDILRLEVGVSVAQPVEEGHTFEYLSEEAAHCFEVEPTVVILFEQVVEGAAQRVKHQAEVSTVVKGMLISHDALLVPLVPPIY